MDTYARLNRPLQITEVTIPAYEETVADEDLQAEIIKNLYSIWFSHQNMEAIIYWNLVDGYAHASQGMINTNENYYMGGLIGQQGASINVNITNSAVTDFKLQTTGSGTVRNLTFNGMVGFFANSGTARMITSDATRASNWMPAFFYLLQSSISSSTTFLTPVPAFS